MNRSSTSLGQMVQRGVLQLSDGYRTRRDQLAADGIPILRVADVLDGAIRPSCADAVSVEYRAVMGPKTSRPGDVLITTKGTVGRVAYVTADLPEHVYSPQLCFLRVLDQHAVDPAWLYYWARSDELGRQLRSRQGQTDMAPYVSLVDLRSFSITLPALDEQRRIAAVLGALDDLAVHDERLRRQALQLASSLFMRGFGGRELGLALGKVADVVDCLHSRKPVPVDDGRLMLQLDNILDDGTLALADRYLIGEEDYGRWTRNLETRAWDCVVTNVGRVGAVARIPAGVLAALGRNMTAVRPSDPDVDGSFIALALLSPAVRREIRLRSDSGTILDALNVRSIPLIRLPESQPDERRALHGRCAPLLEWADSLTEEVHRLRRARDELLPLLLSGAVVPGEVAPGEAGVPAGVGVPG